MGRKGKGKGKGKEEIERNELAMSAEPTPILKGAQRLKERKRKQNTVQTGRKIYYVYIKWGGGEQQRKRARRTIRKHLVQPSLISHLNASIASTPTEHGICTLDLIVGDEQECEE